MMPRVITVVRTARCGAGGRSGPEDVPRACYPRGEIDDDEYRRRLGQLRSPIGGRR
jgi:uncharacterized membrane protein